MNPLELEEPLVGFQSFETGYFCEVCGFAVVEDQHRRIVVGCRHVLPVLEGQIACSLHWHRIPFDSDAGRKLFYNGHCETCERKKEA